LKYKCLSIAGFDGSGGAGLQADLKTFSAFGCYGMTVLTALPIQNTQGVKKCYDIPLSSIQEQLEVLFDDIMPTSIKIGMLFSAEIIALVAKFLKEHAANIPIILDPVMVSKNGSPLLLPEAVDALKSLLIPLATLITPNLPEAYALTEETDDFDLLAEKILQLGSAAILLKGGHLKGEQSNDLFLDQAGRKIYFESRRIESKNTHGTGCTLSAAIAACLALGFSLPDACKVAKGYVFEAIKSAKQDSVGKGHGPVNHFYPIWPTIDKILGEGVLMGNISMKDKI
jgi:hydroxymethylpyrimidine/phosphomethylpyrimidine kinase